MWETAWSAAPLMAPLSYAQAREQTLLKGPNIHSLPDFQPLPNKLSLPVLLKVGDDISTDDIDRAVAIFRAHLT